MLPKPCSQSFLAGTGQMTPNEHQNIATTIVWALASLQQTHQPEDIVCTSGLSTLLGKPYIFLSCCKSSTSARGLDDEAESLWLKPCSLSCDRPADKDARKCLQAFVHRLWGGRAQPVWDGYTRSYQLVQQCCPCMLQKSRMCRSNEAIAGLGAACAQWHALSADHGTALKTHAFSFLGTLASPGRGTWDTESVHKLRNIGFYQQVTYRLGYMGNF